MLAVGTPAPEFVLRDHTGTQVSLSDLRAKGPVVVFFYPGDFTPACSAEACVFRDMHDVASRAGVEVVGINGAPVRLHAAFHGALRLPYRLLSDPGNRVARAYGAAGFMGLFNRRITYLISPGGIIEDAVEASLAISKHRAFMQRVVASRLG